MALRGLFSEAAMHISYFHGTKGDYVQVVSHKDQDKKLKALGFVCSVDDLPDGESDPVEKVESQAVEPQQVDVEAAIYGCVDKNEVESLILSTIGVDIDKRGTLDTVKEKAFKALEDFRNES
jgi:hypothetical protein